MRYAITPNLIAKGDLNPSSFAKGDPSNDFAAIQAGVGDTPIGITGPGTNTPPGTTGATALHASDGEFPTIYSPGSVIELKAGTGGWTRDQFLKPDANGYGVPCTSIDDIPGAYALESAGDGGVGRVLVLPATVDRSKLTLQTITASTALTARDSGKTIIVNGADLVVTLPAAVAGMEFTVVGAPAATGGATGTTVAVQAADKTHGNGFTAAVGKGAVNTQASAADGDWIRFVANGIDGWNVVGIKGTWARVA